MLTRQHSTACSLALEVFLVAGKGEISKFYADRAAKRKETATLDPSSAINVRDIIPICARGHLNAAEELYTASGPSPPIDMICLMQSPHYMAPSIRRVPTLLKATLLYSLVAGRMVLPQEMLLMHGVPSTVATSRLSTLACLYPWTSPESELFDEASLRRLVGNGMHVAQVGSAVLLIIMASHQAHAVSRGTLVCQHCGCKPQAE